MLTAGTCRYALPDGVGEVPFSLSPVWQVDSLRLRLEVPSAGASTLLWLSDVSIVACVGDKAVKWRRISPVGYADEENGR